MLKKYIFILIDILEDIMDTLIELFDSVNFYNMIAATTFKPSTIVMLINSVDNVYDKTRELKEYIAENLPDTKLIFEKVNVSDGELGRMQIRNTLNLYSSAVIDATGGDAALVFLVGKEAIDANRNVIVYREEKDGFVNLYGNYLKDIVPSFFSIQEVFESNGANIKESGYNQFDENEVDFQDIKKIWGVNFKYYNRWNLFISWLQNMDEELRANDKLSIEINKWYINNNNQKLSYDKDILRELNMLDIISDLDYSTNIIKFKFKSNFVKKAMLITGIWLELYLYVLAKESNYFDDVRVSCVVDWNGKPYVKGDVINEIDVVLNKDVHTAFISCKTCKITNEMLNEIVTLKEKLGNQYTKAVLVTTQGENTIKPSIYNRASEMGVTLIDHDQITKSMLLKAMKEMVE